MDEFIGDDCNEYFIHLIENHVMPVPVEDRFGRFEFTGRCLRRRRHCRCLVVFMQSKSCIFWNSDNKRATRIFASECDRSIALARVIEWTLPYTYSYSAKFTWPFREFIIIIYRTFVWKKEFVPIGEKRNDHVFLWWIPSRWWLALCLMAKGNWNRCHRKALKNDLISIVLQFIDEK